MPHLSAHERSAHAARVNSRKAKPLPDKCPECGDTDVDDELQFDENDDPAGLKHTCQKCGHVHYTERKTPMSENDAHQRPTHGTGIYPDGIGWVGVVDVMGGEFTPAVDARMSTGKGSLGPEKDGALQARLLRDKHTSPFEGVIIKVEMVVPLFVLRELDRHRTVTKVGDEDALDDSPEEEIVTPEEGGRKWVARNEMSGRYIQLPNLYYHPPVDGVRAQSQTNKQGTADAEMVAPQLAQMFIRTGRRLTEEARDLYDQAVKHGIEKGLARIYNTQNQYTKIRMTGSLKNWFDFLALRLPTGVLWECRQVALAIESEIARLFPGLHAQWKELVYDTVRLNRQEASAALGALQVLDSSDRAALSRQEEQIIDRLRAFLEMP